MKGCASLNDNLKDPETTSSLTPDGSAFKRYHGKNLFEFTYIYAAGRKGAQRGTFTLFESNVSLTNNYPAVWTSDDRMG